jgi:hypothetical protein
MHEERCGPFFKEKYVDDEAVLDNPSHQPPIPRPPTLHANALPVNDHHRHHHRPNDSSPILNIVVH